MLGRFGLSGHHHLQPICKLSGGQKARVVFTAIALGEPHILLIDEPTNHLDMQSIDALAEALEEVQASTLQGHALLPRQSVCGSCTARLVLLAVMLGHEGSTCTELAVTTMLVCAHG